MQLREIKKPVVESETQEFRYNVVLKTKLGGFKLYLETNINAVSKNDAVQSVSRLLDQARSKFEDVLRQKWVVQAVTPIKPTSKMEHQQRMLNKPKSEK
jgi:hypothetical protein